MRLARHGAETAATLRQRLTLLEQLGGDADATDQTTRPRLVAPGAMNQPNGWLRGAAIRQVAVRLLASTARPAAPIHYADWLSLLSDAGYGIQSRDPAAAFLTQIGRSPVIVERRSRDLHARPRRAGAASRRLDQLNDELLALHEGQQTIEAIATTRERRAELITETNRVERQLEEAIESVGAIDT